MVVTPATELDAREEWTGDAHCPGESQRRWAEWKTTTERRSLTLHHPIYIEVQKLETKPW